LYPWNVVITYDGLAQVRGRVADFEDGFVSTIRRSIKSLNAFGGTREKENAILGSLAKENHEALEQYGSARLGELSAVKPQVANPGLGAVLLGDDPFVVSDLNFCEMVIFAWFGDYRIARHAEMQ
jgi:hypothetical protein